MASQIIVTVLNGLLKEKQFVFDRPANCLVGRSAECDLLLPPADLSVSRVHCLLEIDPPAIRVRDLRSTNGTYVNAEKLEPYGVDGSTERAEAAGPLHDGDEITLGQTMFRVNILDSPAGSEGNGRAARPLNLQRFQPRKPGFQPQRKGA
jgi:pSer/pThr/pTyr-binding forkhead associated (FHA) protein